jgi:hypothetical protein
MKLAIVTNGYRGYGYVGVRIELLYLGEFA